MWKSIFASTIILFTFLLKGDLNRAESIPWLKDWNKCTTVVEGQIPFNFSLLSQSAPSLPSHLSLFISFSSNWSYFLLTLYPSPIHSFFLNFVLQSWLFAGRAIPSSKDTCSQASILLLIDSQLPWSDSKAKIHCLCRMPNIPEFLVLWSNDVALNVYFICFISFCLSYFCALCFE